MSIRALRHNMHLSKAFPRAKYTLMPLDASRGELYRYHRLLYVHASQLKHLNRDTKCITRQIRIILERELTHSFGKLLNVIVQRM